MNSVAASAYFMSHKGLFDRIALLCALLCALICRRLAPCARHLACRYRFNALQLNQTRHCQQGGSHLL